MSADRLREAARVLRERAEAAPGGPWRYAEHGDYTGPTEVRVMSNVRPEPMLIGDYDSYSGLAAAHAAMMHPGVALVLADWLDVIAVSWIDPHADLGFDTHVDVDGLALEFHESTDKNALHIADLILGSAS